jgi:hypothetical protein
VTTLPRFVVATGLAAALSVAAQTPEPGSYRLDATNEMPEQLVAIAPQIEIAGRVVDDAALFSMGTTDLSGSFSNDVLAVGREVNFSGSAGDHVRLGGMMVRVGGTMARSLAAAGQTVLIATNAYIGEDAYVAGTKVTIEGTIRSNVHVYATSVTIGGHISGDVTLEATDVAVLPGTRIDGNFTYRTARELFLDKSVTLGGKLVHEQPTVPASTALGYGMLATLLQGIGTLVTGIVMVLIFPRFTGHTVRMLRHAYWRCSMTGAFLFGLIPLVAILALLTVVGRPFALALGAGYAVLVYLGNVIVGLALGSVLLRQRGPQPVGGVIATLAVGLFALYVAKALPGLGLVVSLAAWMTGLGALCLSLVHTQRVATAQNATVFPGTETPPGPDAR